MNFLIKSTMKKYLFIIVALVSGILMTGCSKDDDSAPEISNGTVQVGDVTIEIPEGALSGNINLTAEKMTQETVPGYLDGFVGGVTLGPSGTKFLKPVKVTVPVSDVSDASKLIVFYWNESEECWESVGMAHVSGGKATFEVTHFSKFAMADTRMWIDLNLLAGKISTNSNANSSLEAVIATCQERAMKDVSDFYEITPGWCMLNSVRYNVTYVSDGAQKSTGYVQVSRENMLEGKKATSWHKVCVKPSKNKDDEYVVDASNKTLAELYTEHGPCIVITKIASMVEMSPDIEWVSEEGEMNAKGDKVDVTLQATVSCKEPVIPLTIRSNTGGSETSRKSSVQAPTQKMPVIKGLILAKPQKADEIKLVKNRLDTDEEGKVTFTVEAISNEVDSQVFFYYNNLKEEPDLSLPFSICEWEIFGDYTYHYQSKIDFDAKCQFYTTFTMGGFKPDKDGYESQEVNVDIRPGTLNLSSLEYYDKKPMDGDADYMHWEYSNVRSSQHLLVKGVLQRFRVGDSDTYYYYLNMDNGYRGLWFADCKETWYSQWYGGDGHLYYYGILFVQGVTGLEFMSKNEEKTYTLLSDGNPERGEARCSGCNVNDAAKDPDKETHAVYPFAIIASERTEGTMHMSKVLPLMP